MFNLVYRRYEDDDLDEPAEQIEGESEVEEGYAGPEEDGGEGSKEEV